MYTNSYASYKSGRVPSSLSGIGSSSASPSSPSSSYASSRYGLRSSSSVPYGMSSGSSSYSSPLSSSTLSALALSSATSRYTPSKSSVLASSAYSPSSSASSSPRLSLYGTGASGIGTSSSSDFHPTSRLTYSRSFNRGSDGYGSWSVSRRDSCRWEFARPALWAGGPRCFCSKIGTTAKMKTLPTIKKKKEGATA